MAGYVVVNMDITDEALAAEHAERIVDVVDAHGGRYIVRGGATEVTDGDWTPGRVVIMEFESVERAREFVNSPGYLELRELRMRCSNSSVVIVEGV